jgi:protease secretion system membrane fusion protein
MKPVLKQQKSDAASLSLNTDAQAMARIGLWLLALGFGGFLLWAGLAPLDQGMAGTGTVVVSGEKKIVQSLVGGAVSTIRVREGDMVEQGQTLLQINTVQAQAQRDAAVGQWISARCLEARLGAERADLAQVVWPPDLLARGDDPRVAATINLHAHLFETRRKELRLRQQMIERELASLQGQLVGYQDIRQHQEKRLAAQGKELESYRALVEKGFIAWNRVHEVERDMGEISVDLSTAISDISRTQQSIQENQLKGLQIIQAYRSDVEAQLTLASAEVANLNERIKALEFELDSANVRAPVSGQVMDLAIHTVGGVATPGQRLMDIVPIRSAWLIKARFPVMAADRLNPGLGVAIRFSSLQRVRTPVLTGVVDTVSADQIVDQQSGIPYYQAMIAPDPKLLAGLKQAGLDIKPGMEVEVLANTGERTLLNYLLKPMLERMHGSFREE